MVTIVLKSGKVFRDVELVSTEGGLVQVNVKRSEVSGTDLLGLVKENEVYNFTEWKESEWWVSFRTEYVEEVR